MCSLSSENLGCCGRQWGSIEWGGTFLATSVYKVQSRWTCFKHEMIDSQVGTVGMGQDSSNGNLR